MFVGKAGAFPSEGSPLKSRLLSSHTNIRLGWKGLPEKNTIAYYKNPYNTAIKSSLVQAPAVPHTKT
jgi:hypothetical protein